MRYLTLEINPETTLTLDNSILGKETIKINNQIMSEKSSLWGSTHMFDYTDLGEKMHFEVIIRFNLLNGILIDVSKNGEAILTEPKEFLKKRFYVSFAITLLTVSYLLYAIYTDKDTSFIAIWIPIYLVLTSKYRKPGSEIQKPLQS
jgi:hypothetical protein